MIGRIWQRSMIASARSSALKHFMQHARSTSFLRDRYVAGVDSRALRERVDGLLGQHGIRASAFHMGEYVDDPQIAREHAARKLEAVSALREIEADIHISVDPTQIGHGCEPGLAAMQARVIAAAIRDAAGDRPGVHCLMLDMEDASLNDPTITLHNDLQDAGLPVALTLQAYLKRTSADLEAQIKRGSTVRLVRGAFAAPSTVALRQHSQIKANYRRLITRMFSAQARERGFYPVVATHDETLHAFSVEAARQNGWPQGSYEFEMLLGVREDVARALAATGERVRLYVPFGQDWWPHAARRIGENPANAALLMRSLIH